MKITRRLRWQFLAQSGIFVLLLAVLVALLLYGALIEVLQSLTSYRFAEWGDLLADAIGLLPGWATARLVGKFVAHR